MDGSTVLVLVASVPLTWGIMVAVRDIRRGKLARAIIRHLEETQAPLFCEYPSGLRFQVTEVNVRQRRWFPYVIAVMRREIAIYQLARDLDQGIALSPGELRWFGRPQKYAYGPNEIWLHAEINSRWFLIKLRLSRFKMQALVRALKEVATPEQVTAYRRRRPYIHYGPLAATLAAQDVYGAWILSDPVTLYLMPLYLVVLENSRVRWKIPLEQIQGVSAIKRLDQPRAPGLVRFEANGEPVAFELRHYNAFASALAEAARRTLEDPLLWQRKKKKDWDDEWDSEDDRADYDLA